MSVGGFTKVIRHERTRERFVVSAILEDTMADEATLLAFRRLEAELDAHYRTLPLFKNPVGIAVYAVVAAFDSLFILEDTLSAETEFDTDIMQMRRSHEEGLAQCLRWLLGSTVDVDPIPSADEKTITQGLRTINYGGGYNRIESYHMLLGKGLVDVEVDPNRKEVRFIDQGDVRRMMSNYGRALTNPQNRHAGINDSAFRTAIKNEKPHVMRLSHELRDGRIVLLAVEQLANPTIVAMQELMRVEFEDIPVNADLGGFTVEEFHRYWLALGCWSHCASILFVTKVHGGTSQVECMPTQCEPKDRFLRGVSFLSGLDVGKAQAITDRLAWGNSIKRPDILLQPLIVGPTTVTWSPRVIELSKYSRNMLKLMTKMGGPTKLVADNLIGQRAVPAAERLGVFLTTRKCARWRYKAGNDISGGGQKGEIDLLAWTPNSPAELLLIEYKAALEAAEIHEVNEVTAQMQEGQEQLRRCVDILSALAAAEALDLSLCAVGEDQVNLRHCYNLRWSNFGAVRLQRVSRYHTGSFRARSTVEQLHDAGAIVGGLPRPRVARLSQNAESVDIENRIGDLTYYLPGFTYANRRAAASR